MGGDGGAVTVSWRMKLKQGRQNEHSQKRAGEVARQAKRRRHDCCCRCRCRGRGPAPSVEVWVVGVWRSGQIIGVHQYAQGGIKHPHGAAGLQAAPRGRIRGATGGVRRCQVLQAGRQRSGMQAGRQSRRQMPAHRPAVAPPADRHRRGVSHVTHSARQQRRPPPAARAGGTTDPHAGQAAHCWRGAASISLRVHLLLAVGVEQPGALRAAGVVQAVLVDVAGYWLRQEVANGVALLQLVPHLQVDRNGRRGRQGDAGIEEGWAASAG